MPIATFPYEVESSDTAHGGDPFACTLYKMLPEPMQQSSRKDLYLLEYLHQVPVDKVGIPEYHTRLSGKLGEKESINLIYPVEGGLYIHVMDDPEGGRAYYIAVEPTMGSAGTEQKLLREIETWMLDYSAEFDGADTPEQQREVLERLLERLNAEHQSDESGLRGFVSGLIKRTHANRLKLSSKNLKVVKYLMVRDKLGMGMLEPMIRDTNIEDISCSGLGALFIEHKVFNSLRTAYEFTTHEELDEFVLRLSERIKKPVTFRNPIVDATLPDGSRINIVYGGDVSKRGSNFTIRKFSETPISILELTGFGTLDYMMAAYLSIVIGEGMNLFVSGETASGKTTLLNAITVFIDPNAKIVSIEDTPELQVPHPNWIREVTRVAKPGEEGSGIDMFDLLRAALRQRPNEIIIGEIRGEEGLIAFQAMQTGHSCMATFHAASVEKLIQRLTGSPISVPKTYIDNLNVVVIQSAVKLPNGKTGRRALSISEIISYDSVDGTFSFAEIFRWDPVNDTFEFVGDANSYLLEQKIAPKRGIPPHKKREIYSVLRRRARVLEKLNESGVTSYHEFYKVIAKAQRDGVF
jgi:flagellar protein FlaI